MALQEKNTFEVLASGRNCHKHIDCLKIHQDAALLMATLEPGKILSSGLEKKRHAYFTAETGSLIVNDYEIGEGNGVHVEDELILNFLATNQSKILLLDLPKL